jgi:hypothetical protein
LKADSVLAVKPPEYAGRNHQPYRNEERVGAAPRSSASSNGWTPSPLRCGTASRGVIGNAQRLSVATGER